MSSNALIAAGVIGLASALSLNLGYNVTEKYSPNKPAKSEQSCDARNLVEHGPGYVKIIDQFGKENTFRYCYPEAEKALESMIPAVNQRVLPDEMAIVFHSHDAADGTRDHLLTKEGIIGVIDRFQQKYTENYNRRDNPFTYVRKFGAPEHFSQPESNPVTRDNFKINKVYQ